MANSQAPYGSWPSPIDARLVAAHDGQPEYLDTVGQEVWWTEPRPEEGGRRALMRLSDSTADEAAPVLPPPWNIRNSVIEYGGKPWAGAPGEGDRGPLVVFTHFGDQRLYAYEPDAPAAQPRPLTPVVPLSEAVPFSLRWCDPLVLPERGEVWCVLEEFTGEASTDVRRVLAAVPLDGSAADDRSRVRELTDAAQSRFVTGPRVSPDGRHVAWIGWDHPEMPWDSTVVRIADITADGRLGGVRKVAGGSGESIPQVEWAPDGALLYVSDASGWWNLRRIRPRALEPGGTGTASSLCRREEEFGGGIWKIGFKWFAPLPSGLIATLHGKGGMTLGILDPETGGLVDNPGRWTECAPTIAAADTRVVTVAASAYTSFEVVELDTCTGHSRVIGSPHTDPVDPGYYPEPVARTFTGPGGREIHAHVYPPRNPEYSATEGELPPYVVWAHGGPNSRAPLVLDLEIAYFTSRGIGVLEVNYGGSTGYGREYRNRLHGQWGVVDVEDCAAAARALVQEGEADGSRLAIRGGSAGGWTSACSLTDPGTEGLYRCATISFPVLDLAGWAAGETHDFESRYLESLIGPFAERADLYRERSPLARAHRASAPFLLAQGLDDAICLPVQCERFLELAKESGMPHAYLTFEGEGHGFRRADTIVRAVEAELSLYLQSFDVADDSVPKLELSG